MLLPETMINIIRGYNLMETLITLWSGSIGNKNIGLAQMSEQASMGLAKPERIDSHSCSRLRCLSVRFR